METSIPFLFFLILATALPSARSCSLRCRPCPPQHLSHQWIACEWMIRSCVNGSLLYKSAFEKFLGQERESAGLELGFQ